MLESTSSFIEYVKVHETQKDNLGIFLCYLKVLKLFFSPWGMSCFNNLLDQAIK